MRNGRLRARVLSIPAGLGVGLVCLVLQACSQGKPPPDACKVVDLAQAQQVLGAKLTAKSITPSSAPKGVSMCNYSDGTVHGGFMLLTAPMHPDDLAAEVASEKKSILDSSASADASLPQPKIQDVSGLGDAAFLVTSDAYLQLHVIGHGVKLVFTRTVGPDPTAIANLEKLAKDVLAGLG